MTTEITLLAVFFLLGLAIGSFLNVWSRRLLRGQSPTGRSHCEHCGHVLSPLDLIPLLSFLLLRGRCRYCGHPLSWQYPVIELLTGIIFAGTLLFSQFNYFLAFPLLVASSAILVIFVTDLSGQVIFDETLWVALLGSFLYRLSVRLPVGDYRGLVLDLSAGVCFYLLLWLIRKATNGKGMGEGDPPLGFVVGLLLGYPLVLVGTFLGFVGGGAVGAALVLSGREKLKSKIALGPFLVAGTLLALFWGAPLLAWYLGFLGF